MNFPEPLCQTSEPGESLFPSEELQPVSLEIGRRILEVFGYRQLPAIVFRLKLTAGEVRAVIDGARIPSGEMLLGIRQITGASIDWLLTGEGPKYAGRDVIGDDSYGSLPAAVRNVQRERHQRSYVQNSNF